MSHHNTDLWRACGPIDAAYFGMWPNGGAWLTQHLWQHYLFTGDKEFLRRYYPVMKGAADFYLSHLVKHPQNGWLVTALPYRLNMDMSVLPLLQDVLWTIR